MKFDFDPFAFTQKRFPFMQGSDVLLLLKQSQISRLKEGEIFIKAGEISYKCAFIIKGLLRGYRVSEEGKEKTVVFKKEWEFMGSLPSMFGDQPAVEEVEALENTWLLVFDFKVFRTLADKNLNISRAYSRSVEGMLMDAVERIHEFTMDSPQKRYLRFVEKNKGLVQRVPLKHIASYLGITHYSLSRIRKRISRG